jgi:hypothetical protein
MKKLTAILPDHSAVDVTALLAASVEFRIEDIPDAAPAAPKRKRAARPRTMSGLDAIMKRYEANAAFSGDDAGKWLVAEGHSASSASACLSKLVKQGRVARSSNGQFRFVAQID